MTKKTISNKNFFAPTHSQNHNRSKFLIILVTISIIITLTVSIVAQFSVVKASNPLPSSANPANIKNKFTINDSGIIRNYSSQGSGEIIGEYFYTTGHNYTLDQVEFLLNYGAELISTVNELCSRKVGNTKQYYREGLIKIPLWLLNNDSTKDRGINYPQTLKQTVDPIILDQKIENIDPNAVYTRGIIKNKGETFLKGKELFNSNGVGLSGSGYKFNQFGEVSDDSDISSYLIGIHIGSATISSNSQDTSSIYKINIVWISNGDGTFSYARYFPSGEVVRVDKMLKSECDQG